MTARRRLARLLRRLAARLDDRRVPVRAVVPDRPPSIASGRADLQLVHTRGGVPRDRC